MPEPYAGYTQSESRKRREARRKKLRDALLAGADTGLGTGGHITNPFAAPPAVPSMGSRYGQPAPGISGTQTPSDIARVSNFASTFGVTPNQVSGPGMSQAYSGGGGGGGAGGGGGSFPLDQWTGFAGNYAASGLPLLYNNPEILARDSLKGMGFNPDSGMLDLAEQQAPLLQYLAMLGFGSNPKNQMTSEQYLNFANDYFKNQMTPGAGSPDVWGMIDNVLNSPEGSALRSSLTGGTPDEQAQSFNTLVKVAVSSLPPVFQKAILNKLEDQTTDWLATQTKGKKSAQQYPLIMDYVRPGGLLG